MFAFCLFTFLALGKMFRDHETVGIKKVLQDKRHKNRELRTTRMLSLQGIASFQLRRRMCFILIWFLSTFLSNLFIV
jgi:hypothetical protein